jgi:signal transduction histidine kinase/DNA-binding response OmpR family regulator
VDVSPDAGAAVRPSARDRFAALMAPTDQAGRFRQFVVLDLAGALGGVVTLTVVWIAFDAGWLWPLLVGVALSAVLLYVSLVLHERGQVDEAVLAVCVTFWLMLLAAPWVVPSIFAAFALLMVWPVLFAVSHVDRRMLLKITVVTSVLALAGLILARRTDPSNIADVPDGLLDAVFLGIGAMFIGLSLTQLWSYSGRLGEVVDGLRDANLALQQSERDLEAKVAERTSALELANIDLLTSREETGRARDEAVRSNRELMAVLDNLADGLLVVEPGGTIARVNPALERMLDLPAAALLGRPATSVLPWLDGLAAVDGETHANAEVELAGARFGKAVASDITDVDGRTSRGTVVLVSDVTAEREIDRMKTDFISTVSHELRTPLTSVLGFAKIIRKRLDERVFPAVAEPDDRTRRAMGQVTDNLDIIVTEGERLADLVNDVLDIAKMEAGRIDWRDDEIVVNDVVEQAVTATSSLFQAKALPVVLELADDLPATRGDHHRLVQVLINLLSNACKFTDRGAVTVRTALGERELRVSVADTGPGVAEADHPKLFERFKQVGDTLTGKPQGTGLGLPICKEIVEHHGGWITVESALGAGATFTFTLPLVASAAPRPGGSARVVDAPTLLADLRRGLERRPEGPRRILVVDDHQPVRQLLREEFEGAGYEVHEAADGAEAVKVAKELQPDLVTLDVMMPELNGFDVAAVLRSDPATMHIPLMVISIVDDTERGRQIGVDGYLTKPVDTGRLLAEAEALIAQGGSHRRVVVVDEDAGMVETLTQIFEQQGWHVTGVVDATQVADAARSAAPDVVIANAAFTDRDALVEVIRAERAEEHVVVVLFE